MALCAWLAPGDARADQYLVRVGGELTAGPSVPGDWSLVNCYAELASALAACAPADTVCLFPETHALAVVSSLPALLTNDNLDDDPVGTEIVFAEAGGLVADGLAATPELRGLTLRGDETTRADAAVTVSPAGALTGVRFAHCVVADFLRSGITNPGGAAISAPLAASGVTVTLDQCTFTANVSNGRGGAVHIGAGYVVEMFGCDFGQNRAAQGGYGGAIALNAAAALTSLVAEDCVFSDNTAGGPAGAIDAAGASVTLRRCDILGSHSADEAGAIFAEGAGLRVLHLTGHTAPVSAILEDCTFTANQGNLAASTNLGDGGGFYAKGAVDRVIEVALTECTFQDNTNAQGAGVYFGPFTTGTVEYCRFLDNSAWYQGGGAMKGGGDDNAGELVTFLYCEFLGNRAGYDADGVDTGEYSRGGGLMVRNGPRADVFNCSFIDNQVNSFSYAIGDGFAHAIEGGEWIEANRCSLINCVFWGTGNDVQAHSEGVDGMDQVSHIAAVEGQLVLGTEPEAPVWLTAYPFDPANPPRLVEGSALIDVGVDLGYTRDIEGRAVPLGSAPDIGAHEFYSLVAVDDLATPRTTSLTVFPNPFNPRTTIAARLDEASSVVLAVYDSRGYRVAELLRGSLPAGTHEVRWDGRDERGRSVAAGTYLARLDAVGQPPVVTKLNLVR